MQVWKEIKIGRLLLAMTVTLLIADTIPHPNLSPGLLEGSLQRVQQSLQPEQAAAVVATGDAN